MLTLSQYKERTAVIALVHSILKALGPEVLWSFMSTHLTSANKVMHIPCYIPHRPCFITV